MMMRWPDIHDGYDCFGMVCEAAGQTTTEAADYYRKVHRHGPQGSQLL